MVEVRYYYYDSYTGRMGEGEGMNAALRAHGISQGPVSVVQRTNEQLQRPWTKACRAEEAVRHKRRPVRSYKGGHSCLGCSGDSSGVGMLIRSFAIAVELSVSRSLDSTRDRAGESVTSIAGYDALRTMHCACSLPWQCPALVRSTNSFWRLPRPVRMLQPESGVYAGLIRFAVTGVWDVSFREKYLCLWATFGVSK